MNNFPYFPFHTGYDEEDTEESINTKFLGLQKDNHLKWNNHTDQIIPKLCGSSYAVRLMFHVHSIMHTVKGIYIAYFHSVTKHGTIFFSSFFIGGGGGGIFLTVIRYLLYKRKLLKLWLVQNPEACIRDQRFYLFHANTYFH
jgi:hypothetical protein